VFEPAPQPKAVQELDLRQKKLFLATRSGTAFKAVIRAMAFQAMESHALEAQYCGVKAKQSSV